MADAIGALSFVFVRGAIDAVGPALVERTEPGEDGAVYELEAVRAGETDLVSFGHYASAAAADAAVVAAKALKGTKQTITQYGRSVTGILIVDVVEDGGGRRVAAVAVGGLGASRPHLLWLKWRVRYCEGS